MNHIMLDLETLDTKSSAVVIAIGAVRFDTSSRALGEKFYAVPGDWSTQQKYGRTISGDTVEWWLKQEREAQQALIGSPVTTAEALSSFIDFIGGDKEVQIWGNGADFDNIILGTLYQDMGFKMPWSFSRNRCYRTMKSLGVGPKKAMRIGTHHNALDDAVTQATHLQEIMEALRAQGNR